MPTDVYNDERVAELLVRYWGLGGRLDSEEKEILLAALDKENKSLRGALHVRALRKLEARGIR